MAHRRCTGGRGRSFLATRAGDVAMGFGFLAGGSLSPQMFELVEALRGNVAVHRAKVGVLSYLGIL
jgi:hypothetical protein